MIENVENFLILGMTPPKK